MGSTRSARSFFRVTHTDGVTLRVDGRRVTIGREVTRTLPTELIALRHSKLCVYALEMTHRCADWSHCFMYVHYGYS